MPVLAGRLAVALTALALASCASRPMPTFAGLTRSGAADAPPGDAIATDWSRGVPIVEGSIDGHGPYRFVLDSGADLLFIDPRIADALALVRRDLRDDDGNAVTLHSSQADFSLREAVLVREIRVGGFVDHDGAAVLIDLSLLDRAMGVRIDGVLPANIFTKGLLTIDHGRGDVKYSPGELPGPDGIDVIALPYERRAFVSIDLAGTPCWFIIDTGDNGFIDVPAAREASLRFQHPPVVTGSAVTAAGVVPQREGRLDSTVKWAGGRITDPVVRLTALAYGRVGIELLREFRTTFDYAHGRVRFERTGDDPIRSPPVRSFGLGWLRDGDGWAVEYVLAGGPAEALGVRVGDHIATIDGRLPAEYAALPDRRETLEPDDTVTLRIVRDGAARDVTVGVKTLVE